MYCTDFEYAGKLLSEFDSAVCVFGGKSGTDTVTAGNKLTLNTITNAASGITKISSTQYDEVFSLTFQIGKINCDSDNLIYDEYELSRIIRWLNQKEYQEFRPIFEDGEFCHTHMLGTFTEIQYIKLGYDVVGFEVTFTSNAPYAYYDEVQCKGTVTNAKKLIAAGFSDEIGYIYPTVKITMKESSEDFVLYNSVDDYSTIIKNVTAGEVITLSGDTKMITSSLSSHVSPDYSTNPNATKLCDDFNYRFPKIINEDFNTQNIFTTNGVECYIEMSYSPICKTPIM